MEELPRVLLISDSISIGYTVAVREAPAGHVVASILKALDRPKPE